MSRLIPLAGAAQFDREVVGGKALGLAMLIESGFRVPDGYVIPPHVATHEVGELLTEILDGSTTTYAYRSSSASEDLATASFAGQYQSVLDVAGAGPGAEAVATVRASALADSATEYRSRMTSEGPAMAVIVQRQVDARVSGVAFSHDPVTGADTVVIEAVAGTGEALMAGEVNPESWAVGPDSKLSAPGADTLLSGAEVTEIARLCRDVAESMRSPQDIEWAIDASGVWLLQARPITALPIEPEARPNPKTTWERSDAFFPEPITPLAYTAWLPDHTRATAKALEILGIPAVGVGHGYFWGRVYDRIIPLIGGEADDKGLPPDPIFKLVVRVHPAFRKRLKTAAAAARSDLPMRLIDAWESGGRDRLRSRTRSLRSVELSSLSDGELADHLAEVRAHAYDCGVEHFKMSFSGWILVGQLGALAVELADWDPHRVIDLVQGHGEASRVEGDALSEVCAAVAADPLALTLLRDSGDIRHHAGPAGAAIRSFIDRYGHRSHGSLTRPTWAEDPEPLIALIRGRLEIDEQDVPDLKAAAAEAVEEMLASVANAADRRRLARAVERAQRGRPYGDETEQDPLDAMGLVHYVAMEAGSRFVAQGRLGERGDVAFLEIDELAGALRDEKLDTAVIARRKAEHRWAMANPAPRILGPKPGETPDADLLPRAARPTAGAFLWAIKNLFYTETFEPEPDGTLRGLAASAGIHEGTARVIRSHAEFPRIGPGDVVVCPSTMASWSSIFPLIGGLVTEVGGPLSHPGTLAREFGLPAVLAVTDATSLIEDGSRIRIDGARGTVSVID